MKNFINKHHFALTIGLLILVRLLHFGSEIDSPHDWRQCDTAYFIWDFYKNGIDLLHPAVCWMGATDTLILEFPLPEALAALGYHLFGESISWARLVFLTSFAGALLFYYKMVCLLFGKRIGQMATLVYLALPLSIYYSRAIHIDFSALFLIHVMVYCYLRGVDDRRWDYILISSLAAGLAFIIKMPYAFFWSIPMLYYAWHKRALGFIFRTGGLYLPAILVFWFWQKHVFRVNEASPDLSYILHYHKMLPRISWYFGKLQERLSLYPWWILLQRGIFEVGGAGGILFLILGLVKVKSFPNRPFIAFWVTALIIYVLLFFNKNVVHNYYQLPMLAPAALFVAMGLLHFSDLKYKMVPGLFALVALVNIIYCEKYYYKLPYEEIEIAGLIRDFTPDSSLVAVTYDRMDCRNPKILYRAHRRGWSIEEAALKPDVLERLHQEQGAQFWAYIGTTFPPGGQTGYYANLPSPQIFSLRSQEKNLYIFKLED